MTHPLRMAYSKAIYKEFGKRLGRDKNPKRTEKVAERVDALGVSYDDFSQIVIGMWGDFAEKQGHPYPYWNMVTGDATFERLETLIELVGDLSLDYTDSDRFLHYESELSFVAEYVYHSIEGNGSNPPIRTVEVDGSVRADAAESFCLMAGIPFYSDDLDYIARQWSKILRD